MASNSGLSREFSALVRSIGESKSKGEEDSIINAELIKLKNTMCGRGPGVSSHQMKEYLLRMLYAEMLGHDASFGHVSAVKLCSSARSLSCKRVAYLAVSACLSPSSDLLLLLVNTLQTDLQSANHLEVQMALQLVCRLMSSDLVPPLIQPIFKAASHMQAGVRKKAVMTLWRCCQIAPEIAHANEIPSRLKSMLCDKDPSVMGATLPALLELDNIGDLCPSIVSILKQIVEHRLARDYDYRRIPAPWIQIKLIQLIGKIAANDRGLSQSCYEVLHEVIKRADTGINIGYAVIYECIRTVCSIYPNAGLLDEAAKQVSRFISSEYHNRKYLGIDALASLVKVEPRYALDHQLVVIDCLDSPDETLRRKTLDLLYQMTGPHNVTVIVEAMMKFITSPNSDKFLRKELVTRILSLAEKFAPDLLWYIDVFNQLLTIADDLIPYTSLHSVFKLLSSASSIDERDEIITRYAARLHEYACDDEGVTPTMVQVIAWVVGEFADPGQDQTVVQDLCDLLPRIRKPLPQSYILSALTKLISRLNCRPVPREVLEAADRYQRSVSVDLQQRCSELFAISQMDSAVMSHILSPMQSFHEIEVDPMLPFLSDFVSDALRKGAQPYSRPENVSVTEPLDSESHLKYTPYATAAIPSFKQANKPNPSVSVPEAEPVQVETVQQTTSGLKLAGITRKWGPSGYGPVQSNSITSPSSQSATGSKPNPDLNAVSTTAPKTSPDPVTSSKRNTSDDSIREKEARAALLFGVANSNANKSSSAATNVSLPAARKMITSSRPTVSAPAIDDLLDINSLTNIVSPSSATPSSATPRVLDPLADLLMSLDSPLETTEATPAGPSNIRLPAFSLCSSFVESSFSELSRSSDNDSMLSHNDALCASGFTLFAEDATLLAVFLQNISGATIPLLRIQANAGSGIVSLNRCEGALTDLLSTSMTLQFANLAPSEVVACFVSLSYKSPVLNVALSAEYNGTLLAINQSVPISCFVRPLQLVTPQFGQMWLEQKFTQNEKRLPPFSKRPDQLATDLNRMRIYVVQTINQESIAAAKIGSNLMLFHIRVDDSQNAFITIRASSSEALSLSLDVLRTEFAGIKYN